MGGEVLVVVHPDAAFRQALAVAGGARFDLIGADSARSGLNACCALEPQCAIIDLELPDQSGLWLIGALREQPTVASTVLAILLGPDCTRGRALEAGFDVCLPATTEPEVIIAQARVLVDRKGREGQPLSSTSIFASDPLPSSDQRTQSLVGSLDRMPAATVLTALELERRTGALALSGVPGAARHRLVIELARGFIARARLGTADMTPLEAVREALAWPGSRFEFVPGLDRAAPAEALATNRLLMAATAQPLPPTARMPAPTGARRSNKQQLAAEEPELSGAATARPAQQTTLMSMTAARPETKSRVRSSERVRAAVRVEEPSGSGAKRRPELDMPDDDVVEAENAASTRRRP